jgi:hypothetical protein
LSSGPRDVIGRAGVRNIRHIRGGLAGIDALVNWL